MSSICAASGWRISSGLAPYVSQAGADTVITLNGFDILTLKDIDSATLANNDFLFV